MDLEIAPGERGKARKHDRIEARCENALVKDASNGRRLVTTVLVDEITDNADGARHSVRVVGRSPARDIIDSTWSEDYRTMTPRELTRAIGKRFGIACYTFTQKKGDPDLTESVSGFSLENESPWQKLLNEAANQAYIFCSSQAGDLYLWKPKAVDLKLGRHLTEGVNVKSIKWTENGAEQFHEYVVTGGGSPARVIDETCRSKRILTIDIDDPYVSRTKLLRRARTEMNRRKENRVTATVSGWGLTDEQIKALKLPHEGKEIFWEPNPLIPVKAPSLGLDMNLLIAEVEHEAGPDVFGSTVTVVNRAAYL
jgi:prophage tail gpP-like protein